MISFIKENLNLIEEKFNKFDKIIYILISLFLISYVGLARPVLPLFMKKLFENILFRSILISYILYKTNHDLKISVFITIIFLYIMHIINKQNVNEMFKSCNCNLCGNSNCTCENFTTKKEKI